MHSYETGFSISTLIGKGVFFLLCLQLLLTGCAGSGLSYHDLTNIEKEIYRHDGPSDNSNIYVFFDGTKNVKESNTNVRKIYDMLPGLKSKSVHAIYIEGVGSLSDAPVTGAVLGRGMEQRIIEGYKFIAENHQAGDKLHIFGFSRGAHQARALAGIISYAGLITSDNEIPISDANRVVELLKDEKDENYRARWEAWAPGNKPLLADKLNQKYSFNVRSVSIDFLGVWDTVPGSSFKSFGSCKEDLGKVKKYFSWILPGVSPGERYKTDTYPTIAKIAHAVSIDEKRDKFYPTLICDPIPPIRTEVVEIWFPGAHSDIGGGYTDSDELPLISLHWMLGQMPEPELIDTHNLKPGNPLGLAHWSVGDPPENVYKCQDRVLPTQQDKIHASYFERKSAGAVPLRQFGEPVDKNYPVYCDS